MSTRQPQADCDYYVISIPNFKNFIETIVKSETLRP